MDPLSVFINLLAKTEGRDIVNHSSNLVSSCHSVRYFKLKILKRNFYSCL